ncbi:hypothetical protein [Albibacterium indicum]|uniref:hypothetical protein n=1 Tax=Albibacterium indicum TaxID=2292082 RepID=UPI000E46D655|nr:hypothetical protein [Pedobacter indicus]
MNKLNLVSFLAIILLVACQSNRQESESVETDSLTKASGDTVFHGIDGEVNNGVLTKECYLEVAGKDSLKLNIEIDEQSKVTGRLEFVNYQMDSSFGEVTGEVIGDTLVLVHEFQAEGMDNKVQRLFLKKNDQYFLGKGATEEVNGIYIYPDRSEVSFENTRVLKRIDCDII